MNEILLDLGEPGYLPPEDAAVAAASAAITSRVGYAPPAGLPALRERIAAQAWPHQAAPVRVDRVIITVGASMGLYVALAAVTQPGDEVLIPDPGYPAYRQLAALMNLRAKPYRLSSVGKLVDLATLEQAIGPRTRAVIWNSPSNPMGSVADGGTVGQLVELLSRHNLFLVSDEVYARLVLDGEHVSPTNLDGGERVFCVSSFSKSHGLSGWRVGYVIAPLAYAKVAERIQWTLTMGPCSVGQVAALASLDAPPDYYADILTRLRTNRDLAVRLLSEYGIAHSHPAGGIFVWIDIRSAGVDTAEFVEALWQQERVSVMPGTVFGAGGDGHIRVLFATDPRVVEEGMHRLGHFFARRVASSMSNRVP